MREGRKRATSWPVLVTHWLGLPLPGSPLWLLHPLPKFLLFTGPHPSAEGRGTAGLVLHGGERGGVARWWWWWWRVRENEPSINH